MPINCRKAPASTRSSRSTSRCRNRAAPGAGQGRGLLAQLPRSGDRAGHLPDAGEAEPHSAVGRRRRGGRGRRRRHPRQGRRPRRRLLLPALDRRPDSRRHPCQRARRRHRRHARGIRGAGRARRGQAAGPPVVRGRRDAAVRGGDGVARARRARPHRRRPDRARAGHRRRLDLRAAIRAAHGRAGDRHLVERAEARARQRARRQRTA